MATAELVAFEVPDLVRVLKGVDPTAFLVPARLLRRVIKQDQQLGGLGLFVPHRRSHVIGRDALLRIVDRQELGVAEGDELPEKVILLVEPDPGRLAGMTPEQTLVRYWRMLFHARIDLIMREKLADGTLNAVSVRARIQQLGATEFDELSFVMQQEDFLLPPVTPESTYAEFVAVYLTLRRFAGKLLPHFFPCLHNLDAVDTLVAAELDVDTLFAATRPPGVPEPDQVPQRITQIDGLKDPSHATIALPAPPVGDSTWRRLRGQAVELDAKGNNVRAAILRTRAAAGARIPPGDSSEELDLLCRRLQKALELSATQTQQWHVALRQLLGGTTHGKWSQETRFLYDLQKVCVDSERGIFTVDLVEWALSLGKKPVRRPLPGHQAVAIVRHLRQALNRLRHVRIASRERHELMDLVQHALDQRERVMRERFRPLITEAIDGVGLKAKNVPDELARAKLVEELLDRVVEYGHFNMGILRDAISRNQFKLPDLKHPLELATGDPLILLNRRLGLALDGVYRQGEIYMRLLHRVSSVAFGTLVGRLLMLFLVLPFGLAFFTMVAPSLLFEEGERLGKMVGLIEKPLTPNTAHRNHEIHDLDSLNPEDLPPEPPPEAHGKNGGHRKHKGLELPNLWGLAGVGAFFLLLFHVGSFRAAIFQGLGKVGRGIHTVFIHGPLWLLRLPALRALLNSQRWLRFRRSVLWPLALAISTGFAAWSYGLAPMAIAAISGGSWLVVMVLLNSRVGRDLEETLSDWAVQRWQWFSLDFVPGLLHLIMDASRRCLEAVEQVLYTVDEWLRFKTGENVFVLAAKALLSVVWFAITYVVRIYVNLLIEPTVNPIKHFPVVTVGHKIMIPFLFVVSHFLYRTIHLDFFGPVLGGGFVGITIFFIPGICGFVVWELKENWKLYSANRARNLKPIMIGSHGETMRRLLRPGFHSGTVPKLFRKLRRAERRGQRRTTRKALAALHHVEESVSHFIERELLDLLRQSKGWNGLAIELASIHLATNRAAITLSCPELGRHPLVLTIDHHDGWLLAGVLEPGWLPKLTAEQRQTLAAALTGTYKKAGVHLTREQIAEALAPTPVLYDLTEDTLMVWVGPELKKAASYNLKESGQLQPQSTNGELPVGLLRPLDVTRLLFANVPLSWNDWVRTWEQDKERVDGPRRELAYAVLP